MKCLLNPSTGEVRRVDLRSAEYLTSRDWQYCTKTLWKTYRNEHLAPSMVLNVVKVQRSIRRV